MPSKRLEKYQVEPAVRAVAKARVDGFYHGGVPSDVNVAAERLGVPPNTVRRHLEVAEARFNLTPDNIPDEAAKDPPLTFPDLPADDLEPAEIIDHLAERFKKRQERKDSEAWMEIKVKGVDPFAICWFGDPHLDSPGCDWPRLRDDINMVAEADRCFGANIGDVTDNWVGSLMRKYADSDCSEETGWKLAKWFLKDSGIDWLMWLLGNHDLWKQGRFILREMNVIGVPMVDWGARFRLTCGKASWRVWASHDFAGHSMWNSLHGAQKAAHMKDMADLYVCGHKHNWALHHEESGSRGFSYWLARAAGYKAIDEYSERLGHFQQRRGASVVSVHDPRTMRIQCFPDVEEGLDYLAFKRRK